MSSPALKRLQQDLKTLKKFPIVGANAEPFDSDMMTWYGLIIPQGETPLAGTPLRFVLEFSNEYPNVAPNAYFESDIVYENGAAYRDANGRMQVCLNLFGNFRGFHTEWGTTSEGWSPSYTVSTILVSMQSQMIDGMLSTDLNDVADMVQSAMAFKCPITNHDGSDPSKYFPKVISEPEEAMKIAAANQSEIEASPLDTFYICYANGNNTARNSVLGYGIHIENSRLGTLSSPCEYLSLDSYKKSEIRRSSTNKPFEHWLPILINEKDWEQGQLIKKGFTIHVRKICEDIGFKGKSEEEMVFKVCSSLMNSLVVEIMNNADDATANDKFINGYFAVYRLLLTYAKGSKLGLLADAEIKKYLEGKAPFTKACVPNLGEFLIYLTISTKYQWKDICKMFMQECDARNVFWYVQGNYNNPPTCPQLANLSVPQEERAKKVFDATAVSRKLVMFQCRFVNVAKNLAESGLLQMEDGEWNFPKLGLVPDSVQGVLKGLYNTVVGINNWFLMFEFLGLSYKDDKTRGLELKGALERSRKQGYHR